MTNAEPWHPTRFDWLMSALAALLVGGFYLDGWAHLHGRAESILTPWHALLFTSAVTMAGVLLGRAILGTLAGWRHVAPLDRAYHLALLGVVCFFIGASGDPLWHLQFGFEVDVETLLSPPHLLLGTGAVLIVSGPFRAGWRSLPASGPLTRRAGLPLLLSLTLSLSLLTFYTEFLHPLVNPWAGATFMERYPHKRTLPAIGQTAGIAALLLQSALLTGAIALLVRRWRLPFGALSLLIVLNGALMTVFRDEYRMLPALFGSGLLMDAAVWHLRPDRPDDLRALLFSVPIIYYGPYMLTLALTEGLAWSIHLWMGALLMAGAVGLLISVLALPPQVGEL